MGVLTAQKRERETGQKVRGRARLTLDGDQRPHAVQWERMGQSVPRNISYSIWEKLGIFTPHVKIMSSELRA